MTCHRPIAWRQASEHIGGPSPAHVEAGQACNHVLSYRPRYYQLAYSLPQWIYNNILSVW